MRQAREGFRGRGTCTRAVGALQTTRDGSGVACEADRRGVEVPSNTRVRRRGNGSFTQMVEEAKSKLIRCRYFCGTRQRGRLISPAKWLDPCFSNPCLSSQPASHLPRPDRWIQFFFAGSATSGGLAIRGHPKYQGLPPNFEASIWLVGLHVVYLASRLHVVDGPSRYHHLIPTIHRMGTQTHQLLVHDT